MAKVPEVLRRLTGSRKALYVVLSVALIGIFCSLFWDRSDHFYIAFIERNAIVSDPSRARSSELFEQLHRRALEDLISEFNKTNSHIRLRLLQRDPPPSKNETNYHRYLASRYEGLAKHPKLLAVFDNCWGSDIRAIHAQLQQFPAPIVFLNADRNGLDFGKDRFFVGNSDQVPNEISRLVSTIVGTNRSIDPANFVFVTEKDYLLRTNFDSVFQQNHLSPAGTVELPGDRAKSRAQFAKATAQIVAQFLRTDSWEEMQRRPKLLVLNGHAIWGEELLRWLDAKLHNLQVVTYQSAVSRAENFSFGMNTNQLILLSASPQNIPESLFLRYRSLKERYKAPFQREEGVFFLRRCAVAMDLCTASLAKAKWEQREPGARFKSKLGYAWASFRGATLSTSHGLCRFSREGELLGQNHFLFYKDRNLSSYPRQLIYSFDDAGKPLVRIVTNIHVGIRRIRIRDVKVDSGTFRADFDYWLRELEPKVNGMGPVLRPIDFKPDGGIESGPLSLGQRLLASKGMDQLRQRTIRVSGMFAIPLDGAHYPFDRHRLRFELEAWAPDDGIRLSREALSEEPEVDGWSVRDSYVALNSRETNPVSGSESLTGENSQYDTLSASFDIQRKLWNAFLLIVFPLGLLTLASVAVLFIKFNERADLAKARTDTDAEARKTQTELSLGCMLAVITYLISYATLAPRLEKLIYSDVLVGLTLLVAVLNFVFVVAISARQSNRLWQFLSLERFRTIICALAIASFLAWVFGGWYFYQLPVH